MPINILVFNWRDIRNPAGGGAEVYTHQLMSRLASKGHEVTLFTSAFEGSKRAETIDGIRIVRAGGRFTVYGKARQFYLDSRERYDVVIDEINTVPFITPRFVNRGEKILALIHQLAREFWYYEMPYPVAWVGYHYLEGRWLNEYKDVPTVTVSNSTKDELIALGFSDVHVVYNGLNVNPVMSVPEKAAEPTVVFVGRLKKAKKPGDAVKAYRILKSRWPELKMTVAGDGYLLDKLRSENRDVEFPGFIDRKAKDELIRGAWAIAVPGVREGWGQVVTDANALGTPAVGYDIPGLRDSIKDGFNGLLTKPDPESMAKGLERLLKDKVYRDALSANAIKWAEGFSWDKSALELERVLVNL